MEVKVASLNERLHALEEHFRQHSTEQSRQTELLMARLNLLEERLGEVRQAVTSARTSLTVLVSTFGVAATAFTIFMNLKMVNLPALPLH